MPRGQINTLTRGISKSRVERERVPRRRRLCVDDRYEEFDNTMLEVYGGNQFLFQ
jgi:hypothetical protein